MCAQVPAQAAEGAGALGAPEVPAEQGFRPGPLLSCPLLPLVDNAGQRTRARTNFTLCLPGGVGKQEAVAGPRGPTIGTPPRDPAKTPRADDEVARPRNDLRLPILRPVVPAVLHGVSPQWLPSEGLEAPEASPCLAPGGGGREAAQAAQGRGGQRTLPAKKESEVAPRRSGSCLSCLSQTLNTRCTFT